MLYAFWACAPNRVPSGLFHDLIYYDLLWGYLHCQMNDGKFLAADALAIIQCNFDLIQPQLLQIIGVYTDQLLSANSNVSLCSDEAILPYRADTPPIHNTQSCSLIFT